MKKLLSILFVFCSVLFYAQSGLNASVNVHEVDCDLSSAKVTAAGGVGPYMYQWSNGAGGDTLSSLTEGNYSIHITDNTGLQTDVSFTVPPIVCKVVIQNKFSPNGDGINDVFVVVRADQYPKFLLQIFDRWGQVVHQQRAPFIPWDGTHLGIKVPDATYYCVFFYEEGKSKLEKGSVTILR